MKNLHKQIQKTIVPVMLLLCANAANASQAIDVAFVVDEAIIADKGREWVDSKIEKAISLSNQTLSLAGLDYSRQVKMVFTESPGGQVSNATSGAGGALSGATEACNIIDEPKYQYYDNVVWLVPYSGDSSRAGNQMYCASTDQHIAVASVGNGNIVHELIAHEIGHMDNMSHTAGDAHYDQTGEVTLMSSYSYLGVGTTLLTAGDILDMQNAHAVANSWPKYYDQCAPSAPVPTGVISMVPESTSVNVNSGTASFKFSLDAPLAQDVSVEFYTKGISASAGVDYSESVKRITLFAGETESTEEVSLITNAKRYSDKTFDVGVRYGEDVNASDSVRVTLAKNATPSEGGGGGGSLGFWGLIALSTLMLRRKS